MAGKSEVMKDLQRVPSKNTHLSADGEFNTYDNTPNERSLVADYQADVPLGVRAGKKMDVRLVAYESFTTNATGGDTETFNLAHNLVDVDTIANDLVLYEAGNLVSPDSVDYDANSFDYTDDGTENPLHAYYVVGDQAEIEIEKVAPKNVDEEIVSDDAGLINVRDQYQDPVAFDRDYDLHGVVPVDWKIEVYVNAPYTLQWSESTDGTEATNMALSIPIRKAQRDIEGLEAAVKSAVLEG